MQQQRAPKRRTDARGSLRSPPAFAGLLLAVVVDVFEVEGVDVAWYNAEDA